MVKLKQKLNNSEVSFGTWIQIGHPAIASILSDCGFDWICIDMEHGSINLDTLSSMVDIIRSKGCNPLVRLSTCTDPIAARISLDAGAVGLILPNVVNSLWFETNYTHCNYPPKGSRGIGYCAANGYGSKFNSYLTSFNDEIVLIPQIESKIAIDHLDDFFTESAKHIDATFVGPLDLSGSYGQCGNLSHPDVAEALNKYNTSCEKHHIAKGMHIVHPDANQIEKAINENYKLIALGLDASFIWSNALSLVKTINAILLR